MQTHDTIDLARLVPSKLNVRKHGEREIAAMAQAIRTKGLLQSLLVRRVGDSFEVVAGGRRLKALQKLAAAGELDDTAIPCIVMTDADDAAVIEASLSENLDRLPMDEMDQHEAFAAMIKKGLTEKQIAGRFGVTDTIVKRRLALARLLPEIRALYRAGTAELEELQALTLASKSRQKEWLALAPKDRPPAWTLKEWALGGSEIDPKVALFDVAEAGVAVATDLFGEAEVVTDAATFWQHQNAAIEAERAKLLASGWKHVEVFAPGDRYEHWKYADVSKAKGGHVVIEVEKDGSVTFHKGVLPHAQAARGNDETSEDGAAAPDTVERPELTQPLCNYLDLVRHGAVQAALLKRPDIALRLMVAHAIGGSELWTVKTEPRTAMSGDIAGATDQQDDRAAVDAAREQALTLLGGEAEDDLVRYGVTGERTLQVFRRLCELDDAGVMAVLASVMAATLSVGTELVDDLGQRLGIDLAGTWKPDPVFWELVKGRDVIDGLLREVCDPRFVSNYATSTGTRKKEVCREWINRRELTKWRPRWLMFPQTKYTPRPLTARARRKA